VLVDKLGGTVDKMNIISVKLIFNNFSHYQFIIKYCVLLCLQMLGKIKVRKGIY